MPKKKRPPQPPVEDLLKLDISAFNAMSEKELRKVVTFMVSAANKRLARMKKSGLTQYPAYADRKGERFTVKGKNLNQLRSTYVDLKTFFGKETSSLKGISKVRKKIQKGLKEKGIKIDISEIDDLFKGLNKMRELHPNLNRKEKSEYRYVLIDLTDKLLRSGYSQDDILVALEKEYDRLYKKELAETGNIDIGSMTRLLYE